VRLHRTLPKVIADILTHNGAIVEDGDDDCLEYLISPSLSRMLDIPEHGRLSFTPDDSGEDAISAAYDSELFRSIEKVFPGSVGTAAATYISYLPNLDKLSKTISEKTLFSNATFRLDRVETRSINYLLVFFKYVALSDEKREGIFPLLVNALNLSTISLVEKNGNILEKLNEPQPKPTLPGQETIKALQSAYCAASAVVKEEIGDFVKSLERRLNRNIKRVHEYYETLEHEAQKAVKKKSLSEGRPRPAVGRAIENILEKAGDGVIRSEEIEKLLNKFKAIETEKQWKVQDLISKYALKIQVKPVAAIVIETQAPLFWINIRRRLLARQFPLTYNPMVRKIDPMPCEACFHPGGSYYVCDDKLHIICAHCLKNCPICGKQYCPACYKSGCPKCKKGKD